MRDANYYDITFIYHPDDIEFVRRAAAQLDASGSVCYFEEQVYGRRGADIGQLKRRLLRAYTVAVVLSPVSAESQLCNELIQYAVTNQKRLLTLILDEDIQVEVHPAIAEHPYLFFRQRDDFAARLEELRAQLRADSQLHLHTELLVAADRWRGSGRRADLLLPPDRIAAARAWLAQASSATIKPSPTLVEFIHGSRRVKPARGRSRRSAVAYAALGLIVFAVAFLIVLALIRSQSEMRSAAEATVSAEARLSQTAAAATEASNSALVLIDEIAATAESVRTTALALASAATAEARATQTAQSQADLLATRQRAAETALAERDAAAQRLLDLAESVLAADDAQLALALAWRAKDELANPKPAIRALRRAMAAGSRLDLEAVSQLRFQPRGSAFALLPRSFDRLQIYAAADWTLTREFSDHEAPITLIAYSDDGQFLASGSADGEIVIRDGAGSDNEPRLRIRAHQGAVTAIAIDSAAGSLVSAGDGPLLTLWRLETGEQVARYQPDDDESLRIDELLFTEDGSRIIGWGNQGGRPLTLQWAADTLAPVTAEAPVYRGADERGRIGYTGGRSLPAFPGDPNSGDLVFWDLATGQELSRLDEGFNWSILSGGDLSAATDTLRFITIADDRALLGVENSVGGQRVALVNIADGSVIRGMENALTARLTSADFVAEDRVISATEAGRVLLWSSADGRLIREIGHALKPLRSVAHSLEGDSVAGGANDGTVTLWRLREGAGDSPRALIDAAVGSRISPDGQVILRLGASGLSLQAVDSQAVTLQLESRLIAAAGSFVAAYADGVLSVIDAETGVERHSWRGDWETAGEIQLASAGDLLLLARSGGDELLLFRGGEDAPIPLAGVEATAVVFDPSGARVLTIERQRARLWDAESGAALAAFPLGGATGAELQAAFNRAGDTLRFFARVEGGLAGLTSVDLADYSARRFTFLDVARGELSPAGETLLLALADGALIVVDAATGDTLHRLDAAVADPRKLDYLPDEGIALIADGRDLSLWDVADGQLDRRLTQATPLVDFSRSRDGARIVTLDEAGVHRLWLLESEAELLARIEDQGLPRALTCAERARYRISPPCE